MASTSNASPHHGRVNEMKAHRISMTLSKSAKLSVARLWALVIYSATVSYLEIAIKKP